MNQSSDITAVSIENYGSSLTETSVSLGSGAVRVVELAECAVQGFDVALATQTRQWAKSADIYAMVLQLSSARRPDPAAQQGLPMAQIQALLQLYWRLDCFPKPLVALLDAPVDGSTAGLTGFGTHRVAGENYRFSLAPHTGIPAAGIAYALARIPGPLAHDLALSGRSLDRAEAWAAGLVTHCIPSAAFPAIIAALADGQPVDPLLDGLHEDPRAGPFRADGREVSAIDRSAGEREAIEALIAAARRMDVHDSLVATARVADALRCATGQGELFSADALFSTLKTGDLQLPPRSEL